MRFSRSVAVLGVLLTTACGRGVLGTTPAVAVRAVSGSEQIGEAGTALPDPLVVEVTEDGEPRGMRAVAWFTPPVGTLLSVSSSVSDASGRAENRLVLPAFSTGVEVTAGIPGGTTVALFRAYSVPRGAQVIEVQNNVFVPSAVTIQAGSQVAWVWRGESRNHSIVPDSSVPAPSGGVFSSPRVYQTTFDVPGTYRYFCSVHGARGGSGMSGTITVL